MTQYLKYSSSCWQYISSTAYMKSCQQHFTCKTALQTVPAWDYHMCLWPKSWRIQGWIGYPVSSFHFHPWCLLKKRWIETFLMWILNWRMTYGWYWSTFSLFQLSMSLWVYPRVPCVSWTTSIAPHLTVQWYHWWERHVPKRPRYVAVSFTRF